MRQLETSSLSNQDIHAYLLTHTYTADADRAIFARITLDQVAGGGDYLIYATIKAAGAGSAYMAGPITTFTVPVAQTAICFVSGIIPVNNTDVVKFYVKGLAGDTTTPDIVTRIFELTYVRPTVAGRTLDVAATGEVGLDFDNIHDATAPHTLTNITMNAIYGGNGGLLSILHTLLNSVTNRPVSGATCELYANPAGTGDPIDTKITNVYGQVTFSYLTAGTYYVKNIEAGCTTVIDTVVVI